MKYFLTLIALFSLLACSSSDDMPNNENNIDTNIAQQNDLEIQKYLTENNIEATKTSSGLYYFIRKAVEEDVEKPNANSNVEVSYAGYLTNGQQFDRNTAGITFNLQDVITGWTEGLQLFKVGERGTLFIPSHLGYGAAGNTGIPGNAVIIFDINLLAIPK